MFYLLLSPLSVLLVAGALLICAVARGWPRVIRVPLALVVGASLLMMAPLGANVMVHAVESRVPPPDAACLAQPPQTIVVLSGGFDRPPKSEADFSALTVGSVRRLTGALQLLAEQPGSQLVIAGRGHNLMAESRVMGALARQQGVAPERLRLETASLTTADNALQLAALSPPLPRRIWLVSSALHLPRALGAVQRAGFTVCAYPTDSRYLPPGGFGYYLPQTSALAKSEAALHELAGSVLYAWRSREGATSPAVAPQRP